MNALGVIAVVDLPSRSIVWVRKMPPVGQHDPQVLANGNLLLFENNENSGHSRVVERRPGRLRACAGPTEARTNSPSIREVPRVAVQRLPNG